MYETVNIFKAVLVRILQGKWSLQNMRNNPLKHIVLNNGLKLLQRYRQCFIRALPNVNNKLTKAIIVKSINISIK